MLTPHPLCVMLFMDDPLVYIHFCWSISFLKLQVAQVHLEEGTPKAEG